MRSLAIAALVFALLPACSTYGDELARGQHAFEQNQHERALAIFRILEPDTSHLTEEERAHYAYLRGMTDYRIGYKADARHWLAVGKAVDEKNPGLLPAEWRTRLDEALLALDTQIYTGGMESLTNSRKRGDAEPPREKVKASPAASDDDEDEEPVKPKPKKKKPAADDE